MVEDLSQGKTLLAGLSNVRDYYARLFAENPKLHCELRSRMIHANCIVDEEFVTGILSRPQGLHAVVLYTFKDGKIYRVYMAR